MARKKVFQIGSALTEGLEETVAAAEQYAGDLNLEVVPIKKIEMDPENPRELSLLLSDLPEGPLVGDPHYVRKVKEKEQLQTIATSIKEQGIINPIMVYKHGDRYRLIAGERRTLASLLAGKAEIQARVLDKRPNPLKLSLMQWAENIERADLSLYERVRNLEKILLAYSKQHDLDIQHITATQLAQLLGCSLPHAMNYRAVLNADPRLKDLIRDDQIKNLEKAALLTTISDHDLQEAAIQACMHGATLKKLKSMKQALPTKKIQTVARRKGAPIQLGSTSNVKAIQFLVDCVVEKKKYHYMNAHFAKLNWQDNKAVTDAFGYLLAVIEEAE